MTELGPACRQPSRHQLRPPRRHGCRGLSLVELMVAIAIGLFMVGALITLYVNSNAARLELDRSSRQIENGRFAIDMMRDDIAMAGYFGELASAETLTVVNPEPCATTVANMGWNGSSGAVPAAVQGPPSTGTSLTFTNCTAAALNQRAGTGFLVVRRLDAERLAAASAQANAHYLQINGCLSGAAPFVFNVGSAGGFTMQGADCSSTAPIRQYESRLYYVSDCGVCSPSDGVPTLKLRELVNSTIVERVIADGIEDIQFEFGLDTDTPGDGVANTYVTSGAATDWRNVVSVRIHLISRSTTPTPGYTDDKTYSRGPFGAYTAPSDATQYKRRYYTTIVHMPNSSGQRESP